MSRWPATMGEQREWTISSARGAPVFLGVHQIVGASRVAYFKRRIPVDCARRSLFAGRRAQMRFRLALDELLAH